jgi:Skp family chaperone for outer membrane proteins
MLLPSDDSFSAPMPSPTELSSSVVYRQQQQQQQQRVPRAAFLRSIAFGGTAFLFGIPTLPASAKDNNPAAQIQAGLADFDRAVSQEANKIDRAATKEKKKMTKEIKKETKKIDKKIQKEVRKIEKKNPEVTKKVKKETKKVMREVDKKTEKARQETEKVKREAKKIGSGLEQKANAFVGGTGSAVAVPQARSSGVGGIDVSRLKVCGDGRNKCVR